MNGAMFGPVLKFSDIFELSKSIYKTLLLHICIFTSLTTTSPDHQPPDWNLENQIDKQNRDLELELNLMFTLG